MVLTESAVTVMEECGATILQKHIDNGHRPVRAQGECFEEFVARVAAEFYTSPKLARVALAQ